MEQKIKQIERLLVDWEAGIPMSRRNADYIAAAKFEGGVMMLTAAIRILKEPSNQAIATETCECGEPKAFGFDYCLGCCNEDVS